MHARAGLSIKFDAPITHGGEETALSHMENVLASLTACGSFHVLTILNKKRPKISNDTVEATGERREEPHQESTKIHLKYISERPKNRSRSSEKSTRILTD
jgi:uncharacterized OsmC-like protein